MIYFENIQRGLAGLAMLVACATPLLAANKHDPERSNYSAPRAGTALAIDGVANESVWQRAEWRPLNQRWLGPEYSAEDFSGQFKVAWNSNKIYILFDFTDDVLIDSHRDPLLQYWDDDCLEIFLDEDFSGGNHQFDHNAFAYHVSLDNQAVDIGTDERARNYSHHVESRWQQNDNRIVWELAIDIYSDAYQDGSNDNEPIELTAGKILGLMVAYCDNDGSELRENFIGSENIADGSKDRGYIDANIFGSLTLVE